MASSSSFRFIIGFILLVNLTLGIDGEIVFEEGYTVTTVIDGDKLQINPYSVFSLYGSSSDLIILDSVKSTVYTVSFSGSEVSEIKKLSGNGDVGYVDGDLRSAMFNKPKSFALDRKNNIYIADKTNHVIRKISKSGVTTIAGGYEQKIGKADGPAQNASFSNDFELAFDPQRCALLISDHGNRLVRQLDLKAEDCVSGSSGSGLGSMTAWGIGVGVACLIVLIIGFAIRPYILPHTGSFRATSVQQDMEAFPNPSGETNTDLLLRQQKRNCYMNSSSTQYLNSKRMDVYEPMHQFSMWGDFKGNVYQDAPATMIIEVDAKLDNQSEDTSHTTIGPSNQCDQEASKPGDKVLRRLAQNREAARKSRLRKKAYVQQLEVSRLKLLHLEQELEQTRAQCALMSGGINASHLGFPGGANSGIGAFKMEYEQWVEEQNKKTNALKTALHSPLADTELHILVDDTMNHYANLFTIKANAAKADVCYLISGVWKTSTERLFLWIGGFRPSELLKVLVPQLDLLDQQSHDLYNLIQGCQRAEDSLSQAMEKLQQTLAEAVACAQALGGGCYEMTNAMDKLEELVRLVIQADYIRQETLQQTLRYLTTRQAAQGLISLGEYFQRLRDLSSAWAMRLCEPA